MKSYLISSDGSGNIALLFTEDSRTEASPIIDDVLISTIDSSASATPLPGTLPLFVSGLGALGLMGWRRKRKNLRAA